LVGFKGDLSTETQVILMEHDLVTSFSDKLLIDLPPAAYILSESDIANREDFTNTRIFTIDSDDSIDLDDAISCQSLTNENFLVKFFNNN
jgi:exoribonuclease R